jgi:hypothetical protein
VGPELTAGPVGSAVHKTQPSKNGSIYGARNQDWA